MAGTNILVRQKDLIAGSGISITPDTTSGNVTIAAASTAIDESRLLPTGGRNGNLLEYQEGVDRGNDVNTKLLIQPATSDGQIIDSAYGNEAPVGISQGTSNSPVTVENGESLAFSGSSAYLTIAEEDAAKIITGTNEWCFDVLITPEWSSGSAGAFHLGGGNYSIYINPSTGNSWIWSLSESGTIGLFANETHLLTLEQWLDGSTWKLSWYCDGVPKRTESFQYPVPDKTIRIGRGNDNDGYFQGKMNNIRFRTVANHRGASFAMPPFPFLPPAGQPVWAEGIDRSRLLKVPTSADEGKLPVIRADKIPAVYHDTTLAAIVIEGDKVIDKISGKELTKVGSPQIIDGGIHSPTNSDYYMLELEGVEGLPVAVSFDYQGDESPDSSNIVTINGNCAYYSMNGVSFCRSQGGGNNIKIDNQPVGISEAYRNYVMQVSSDNYESKTPPVAFIAGESKSPTYEGSFPAMSPLSSVKVCGRFGKIRNILIGSAFPYTGNFTPRGDGVEGFGVPEKLEPGWNYETLDEAANGRLLPANPANGDIPCFDATATIGGGNDETVKFLLQPATTDGELIDSAAGAVTPATITNHSLTVSESGEIEFSSSKYATVPASGILADVLRHDKPWVFDLLVYLDQTSSQSRFFGTESGGDFFCQWTGDYGFDFKYGDTWISTLTGNVGEWNLLTLEYYQKNGTWHVALYLQGVLCQDKEISTSFDPKTSELAIGRSTSGSHLCSGKIRAIRIREGALYNGQSFTPDEFPYREPQTVGEWGKFNKSELVQSVNGVAPNESGNVILDASTIIDNSRLLPVLDALPEGYEGSLLAVQRGDGKVADENTLRLMHFNDDVRDVVTDETGTLKGNASITPTGYFDGALSINHAVVSSLSFNGLTATPTAWTMDFRVKLGRFSGNAPLVLIGTNLNETQTSLIRVDSSYIDIQATYNQRVIYKTHSLQLDTWYHFALTYDGTTYKFYVDGKLFGSGESANQFDFTRKLWFGSFYDYSTSYVSDCTIDEFRLSNVVRWTENFTPPDAPYGESLYNWGIGPKLDESRLLPETGSVSSDSVGNPVIFKAISRIDNTYWLCLPLNEDTNDRSTYDVATGVYGTVNIVSNAPSSPGGSAFFNGSSCLHGTLPAQFGASDFTVRLWMMAPTISSSSHTIFSTRRGNQTDADTFGLLCTTEGRLFIYSNGDITSRTDTPFTLQSSVWYHVAVVRKSGVLTIYVNGEVYNSATFTNSLTRQIFGLGASWTGSSYSEAGTVYLTSLDVLNYAAYDGAFTTPAYQPGILAGMGYQVAEKGFVPSDSKQLLPANPDDQDLTIYRVFPEEAAPQNLTSATSDPNWEVTWSGAYSGRVGWWAFDSDQSTMWCTYQAAVGDWLCWEYKGVEGKVLLRRYSIAKASGNGDCPTGWKIQGSNDGSIWVDLDEQTGQSFPDNNAKEYTIPNNSTPYKFHRFYLLSWNTSNMIGTFKAWSWINSTEERKVWLPINKSEFVVNDARLLPGAPSDTTNSYWLNSGPVATQVSPASYAGSTDATWTMELSGTFEGGDIATLFDSDTTNGVSGTLGLETFGTVRWIRKDQVPYRIDQIVLRAQTSDIGAFPQTIYLSGYDKSTFSTEIVQEFNAPVWETESNTSTYATSFTRVCTLEVNAPAFQSYDYSIALGSGAGMETTLQAFAAYQLDTETAWKQLNTATTTTAGLMSATDKAALTGLTTRGIYPNALAKSGAVDFNEVIDHGFYFIGGDTPHLNYPETYKQTGGTLQVIRNGNYLTQTLILFDKNKSFNRSCFNAISGSSDRKFSAWQRLLTDTEITESMADPGYFKLPNGTIAQYGGQHVSGSTNTIQLPITVATISYQHVSVWGDNSDLEALDVLPMVVLVEPGASPISSLTAVTKTADGSTWGGYITWLVIGTV